MKFVFFNGPKLVGKDTLADILIDKYPDIYHRAKMATPMKNAVHELLCMTPEEIEQAERMKDIEQFIYEDSYSLEYWHILRHTYIEMSETFAKHFFGEEFFGAMLVKQVNRWLKAGIINKDQTILITDIGFESEIRPVIKMVGVEPVMLIRLHSENCNFIGDSRNYLPNEVLPDHKVYDFTRIENKPSVSAALIHKMIQNHFEL